MDCVRVNYSVHGGPPGGSSDGMLWLIKQQLLSSPAPLSPVAAAPRGPQRKWTKGKPVPWGPSQPEDQLVLESGGVVVVAAAVVGSR